MNVRTQCISASLLLSLLVSAPAWADDDDEDDLQKTQALVSAFKLIPPAQAEATALAAKPGVVKDIELERRKLRSGWDYEVEIVDSQGAEWEVCVDAKSGKVSSVSRDWF